MNKATLAWGRGTLCALTLAALSACNFDGSGSSNSPGAPPTSGNEPPTTPLPNEPAPNQPTNVAPKIVGNPGNEVLVGSAYSFAPTASDADGDDLSFSIEGKPSWASFNEATGRLSGTPDAADVGSYEEIVIRVSDGNKSRALPQFAINVVEHSSGSVSLTWQPPTQNTDGSPLTNLNGYRIHYGTQSGNYEAAIDIDNSSITRYVVENLAPGTYFFAVSAVSQNGAESDLSGEASKTI